MSDENELDLRSLRAADGVEEVFAGIYERFRPRLERAVDLRMDARVRGRVDAGDVVQEAYIECARRIDRYLADPPAPLYLWVRYVVLQRLLQVHRAHLVRHVRDVGREVSIDQALGPGADSERLAAELADSRTSPTGEARRAEAKRHVKDALDRMSEADREILVLRHFEQLSSADAAVVLGIDPSAARKRYIRALRRIQAVFEALDGSL